MSHGTQLAHAQVDGQRVLRMHSELSEGTPALQCIASIKLSPTGYCIYPLHLRCSGVSVRPIEKQTVRYVWKLNHKEENVIPSNLKDIIIHPDYHFLSKTEPHFVPRNYNYTHSAVWSPKVLFETPYSSAAHLMVIR